MPRVLSLLLILLPGLALADSAPLTYDRINLAASASESIDNDTLVAVMYLQAEGNNPARLADEVNRGIQQAIDRAKQAPQIKVQTLDYNTNPVYNKQRINGWRVRQSIRLESRDSTALSALIGELQEQLSVQQISYQLSEAQRQVAEERLIGEAIGRFQARADLIRKTMQRPDYRLVNMNINTGGMAPRPYVARGMAMEMQSVAAPAIEAGTQQVQVTISGTIELEK